MKTEYLRKYGHKGNKTTAMIAVMIAGRIHVLGSAVSNLNEANLDLAFFSLFSSTLGYLNLVRLSGLSK
jgi:hypothetical protein